MTQEVKHCQVCGKQLGWHQIVYCSYYCRNKSDKHCVICNKELLKRQRDCCSIDCRTVNYRRQNKKPSDATLTAARKALTGRKRPPDVRRKIGLALTGKKLSKETCAKLSLANRGRPNPRKGSKSNFWKGGISPKDDMYRATMEYAYWRLQIYERDNFTCQHCGKAGGRLNAHHIMNFAQYPELRFEVSNGITLCPRCHGKIHNNVHIKHIA